MIQDSNLDLPNGMLNGNNRANSTSTTIIVDNLCNDNDNTSLAIEISYFFQQLATIYFAHLYK